MERLDLASRWLMSAIFIGAGLDKFRQPEEQEAYLRNLGVSRARQARLAAGAIEIAGGAALAAGVLPGLAAAALAVYLIPVTGIAHRNERVHLMKNLAIIGGLLQVVHARRRRSEKKRGRERELRAA